MQSSYVPADATTALVVNLTAEEKEYLLQRVTYSMKAAKSNMTDPNLTEPDREHYFSQYQLGVRLLTKLGA
jgi:hypothetical protein